MSPPDPHAYRITARALDRQLAALPCSLYEIRLIHGERRQPYPGVRRWTAEQILRPGTVRFLRLRNREGYDVYFRPYAPAGNAGYILLDLDRPLPGILARLRAHGHEPSVLVQTSPGRLQAWIRVSLDPLPPASATGISRRLAQLHTADPASAEGRHLGRLAGFTNRKPQRRRPNGLAPWVQLFYSRGCLARDGAALLELAAVPVGVAAPAPALRRQPAEWALVTDRDSLALRRRYQACLEHLRIPQRYPSPDWSIADKWVARLLLATGTPPATVAAVLRYGSPGFPRRHADPEDYLHRTLLCAARQLCAIVFPARSATPTPEG